MVNDYETLGGSHETNGHVEDANAESEQQQQQQQHEQQQLQHQQQQLQQEENAMEIVDTSRQQQQRTSTTNKPKTTTIGTIALQSGGTRLVIALLENGEYLRLKVLDIQPELTKLGATPEEAKELLKAHDEVLLRLQSKQSPVEELLKQADRVISTQKPKAEVYKAMAETLASAWKDVNELLERRKHILERNVLFQCRAAECRESMKTLEMACNDTHLPIEIESVKNFLKKIHELRKTMLENLMSALKEGKGLLDQLRDIANEGTIDSRPDRLKPDADSAIHKVEGWLEELHDKRRTVELSFSNRKTQLEQCLGLALLATDLRELEDTLNDRINALSNSSDHLGDSVASTELLLLEVKKLQVEAKDFQDRAIKITKSTEHLVSSGHFAGEQATEQAYAILGAAADYINDLDQYELMLNRSLAFFDSAQLAYTKLDQLEIQLATTEHPPRSSGLTRLHQQSVKTLEDITSGPLAEGHALLEITGRGAPGAEGVRRTVEEIEDRKIRLLERCTAHREENVRISRCINDFLEKYEELSNWLSSIVEAFLRGHQDMGSNLTTARDFYNLHVQLLEDLDKRAEEVRRLDREIIPSDVLGHLQDSERADIFDKVEALRSSWTMSRSALEARLQLAAMYVDFHLTAADLERELDHLEDDLKGHADDMSDEQMRVLEKKWAALQPCYANLTSIGKKFLDESAKIVDSYLDLPRACLCVQSVMEKFANKQFNVTQQYETMVTTVTIRKELRIEQEKRLEESTRTIQSVSKFQDQLYPIITCDSMNPLDILKNLENSRLQVIPELNNAVTELDSRIKNIEGFGIKDDTFNIEIKKKLTDVAEQLRSTSTDYKSLLDDLISIFDKLSQVVQEINVQRKNAESSPTLNKESFHEVRVLLERLESLSRSASETFKQAKQESERVIVKIQNLEPAEAAREDIEKLNQSFRLVVDNWNAYATSTKSRLQERLDFCSFGVDLDKNNAELHDLEDQLRTITGWLGENLSAAKGASEAFPQFERTLNILEQRIVEFVEKTEVSAGKYLPQIQNELASLQNKLQTLKKLTDETRQKINPSIKYFELLEETKDWFNEGSKLLNEVTRKATTIQVPEDATTLLNEIDAFLKPGEEIQEQRIEKIRGLSTKIYGTDRLPQFNDVVVENRNMLDSFAVISSELHTVKIKKELRIEQEKRIEESTRTIQSVSKFTDQLYPIITCDSTNPSDIVKNLENSRLQVIPELNNAVTELDSRIKNIEGFAIKDDAFNIEIQKKLTDVAEQLRSTSTDYKSLLDDLISTFEKLSQVVQEIDVHRKNAESSPTLNKESLHEVRALLERLETLSKSASETFKRAKQESEKVIVKIQNLEPVDAARQDTDKLNQSFRLVVDNWNAYATSTKSRLQERLDFCLFGDDLDKINAELRDLADQLGTIAGWLGESLSAAKGASEAFSQFEKTLNILEQRIVEFVEKTEESAGKYLPKIQNELSSLQNKLQILKKLTDETRKKINSSIEYFELLEETREWFKEGSKLLIAVARKATSVKVPEEATTLLNEIDAFLKPGEEIQEQRIEKIRGLSTKIYGTDRLPQFNDVVVENRDMLDSFAVISSELRTLAENLRNAEDLREKLQKEREEADARIKKAQAEALAAQAIAAEAENARKIAERLTTETLERAAEEARRIALIEAEAKDRIPRYEVATTSAQTEAVNEVDAPKSGAIEHTITKEIHIVQKTEIEEEHISTVKQAQQPIIEPAEIIKEETIVVEEMQPELITPQILRKPEFTVTLYDATIQEGEKFRFECRVVGQPRPEISWHKDGIPILNNPDYLTNYEDDGRCTLTIEETFAEDSAKFSCKATNELGSVETEAVLKVKETSPEEQLSPPIFVKELNPSVGFEGSAHQLECKVQGNPLPTVQWFKNDVNIDNSPDYTTTYNNGEAILKFDEVYLNDQGTYTCKAANKIGHAVTSTILTVEATKPNEEAVTMELPKITKSPSNVTVMTGEKITLECEATGTPPVTFVWTHDGKSLDDVKTVKIHLDELSGKSNLVVLEAYPKDAGKYEVTARNAAGESKAGCDVAVKVKPLPSDTSDSEALIPIIKKDMEPKAPKIQLPLKDLTIIEGASARLDCIIIGQPEPEVIWYHDDRPVKESADFQLLFQGDRCSLVIHEAFLDDAGVYKVVAINTGGEASSECTLSITPRGSDAVESSPKFVKLLTDLLIAEGEETVFECVVTGEPKPTVIWYLNGEALVENERIKIQTDDNGRSILKILPTKSEDKGNYTAKATNRVGEAKSFAKLVVKVLGDFLPKDDNVVQMEEKLVPPYFKEKFENRIVPEGVTTKFECIAVGKPAPKIQWFFNERPVHGKDFLVSVSGDRQVLTIPEVGSVHAGNISCVAENAAGKAVCDAKIEVGGGVKAEEGQIVTFEEPIVGTEMQASSSSDKFFSTERTTGEGGLSDSQTMTKTSSSIMESSTTHTSTKKEYVTTTSSSTLSSCPAHPPSNLCVKKTSQSSEHSSAYNGAPPVVQSQKIEEYERIVQDAPGEIRQEKTVIVTQDSGGTRQKECKHQIQVQKPCRKQTAPRFTSPVTGMIVDQGSDIVLEGIVDGFPQPMITWTRNGQEVIAKNGLKVSYDHNHVKLEIRDVKVKDAGRYTCTARNEIGNASSTADLVVKKTIFPPVFGRRLQAQVVKKGERVIMEVEITGTPDPEVTWYKDDEPLIEPEYRMKKQGNCYLLLIDKAEKEHAGKYMVRATNAGGEAQSIADFAVFEPTPDTMIEMHKTLVYENVQDKNAKKPCCGQPTEIPGANLTTEQITTTMIQPSAAIKTPFPPTSSSSSIRTIKSETTEEHQKASRTEMISSSIESHKSETKSEQKFHMKLEHKPAPFDATKREEKTETKETTIGDKSFYDQQSEVIENENIETSSMARKDALSFFESMSKGSDTFARGPKEMIKLTNEDDGTGPGCDVRVDQLTKNYERSTKFEEAAHEVPKPDIKAGKKAVQEIFNKFEKGSSSNRGVDNTLFDFPYEEHKLAPLECKRTILEDVTASGSPIHGTLTISKLAAQSESAEAMLKGFNLVPEPPPEIGYAPKPEELTRKRPDVSTKAKQLQESFEKGYSPVDAPIGGVKIFPSPTPKMQPKTPEKIPTRPLSIPPPFELGKSEIIEETCIKKNVQEKKDYDGYSSSTSTDALTMEKSWAHKSPDSSKKSWPPQHRDTTTTFSDKQEWNLPEQNYKVSSTESKQDIELKPEYRMTQTTIESSSSLEKKSFGSKEINVTEKKTEPPPSPPKPKPIIYNAETIKVDHTVNTIEEKSVTEKYTSECDVHKTELSEKKYETIKKQAPRPWPDGSDLRAPSLVKSVSDYSKPAIKLYHQTPTSPVLQPGTPPEIGFAPGPFVQEKKVEKVEKIYEQSSDKKPAYTPPGGMRTMPPPTQSKKTEEYYSREYKVTPSQPQPTSTSSKYSRSSFYSESDYESEIDNTLKSKWRSESDSERTSGYRRVQAPVSSHTCRPKSTEPEPLPPSRFEVPPTSLTGPARPVVTPDFTESKMKKSSTSYEKDSRQYQQRSQTEEYGSLPKPGSPPVYVQPTKPVAKTYKPESPKFKSKTFQQESGYMADTEEPLRTAQHKSFSESCSSFSETKSSFMESKSYSSSQQKKDSSSSSFSQTQSYSSTPKTEMQRTSYVEKIVEKSPQPRFRPTPTKDKPQMTQSSSRFAKGEFRESDYESDYDSSRISSLWKPQTSAQTLSDTKSSSIKSVKSSFSSSGKTTAAPSSFAETTKETVTKKETVKEEKPRPKSVLLPGSPPEIAYAPPRQSYYEGHTGVPYHNAVGTETKKTVRMDESTENTRRIVTVEQTSRVIKFGENQSHFESQQSTGPIGSQQQRKSSYSVPTPKKFVQGQFRESDYESDADTSRIRAKWAPSESETEEPRYRKVQPPKAKTSRSPIITMPSDTEAERSESERRSTYMESTKRQHMTEGHDLKPGSPPEFAFAPAQEFKKTANHVASKHISDMTSSFKSKTEKFSNEIQSDLKMRSKPILKRSTSTDAGSATDGGDDPRTYREESRVAQYGTKHIDPDTGLIYFKYDFGYEFGIVLPGEGKRTVASSNQSYKGHRKPGDIDVPIIHEFTSRKENGFAPKPKDNSYSTAQNCHTFPRKSNTKFGKTVKWEPTSESEYSEAEDFRGAGNKISAPPSLLIPNSPSPRWDPTTPSPGSLSPSLPSLSPRYGGGPSSNVDSMPGSPWSATNGERIIPVATEVVKPYIEILPKKAPLFITPLRDIAAVSGQTARFECIVQAEPQPNIIWSKDGRIIENSFNSDVYYRNGVCRLTLTRITPDDAGTYACTATNSLGSSVTSATLQVPGNRRSVYGIN